LVRFHQQDHWRARLTPTNQIKKVEEFRRGDWHIRDDEVEIGAVCTIGVIFEKLHGIDAVAEFGDDVAGFVECP
jgi:hypothetical protein